MTVHRPRGYPLPSLNPSPNPFSTQIPAHSHPWTRSRSRIRSIHQRNLPANTLPFHLPLNPPFSAFKLQMLIPLHELVDEAEVRLDDHVEAAGADETAILTNVSRGGKMEIVRR